VALPRWLACFWGLGPRDSLSPRFVKIGRPWPRARPIGKFLIVLPPVLARMPALTRFYRWQRNRCSPGAGGVFPLRLSINDRGAAASAVFPRVESHPARTPKLAFAGKLIRARVWSGLRCRMLIEFFPRFAGSRGWPLPRARHPGVYLFAIKNAPVVRRLGQTRCKAQRPAGSRGMGAFVRDARGARRASRARWERTNACLSPPHGGAPESLAWQNGASLLACRWVGGEHASRCGNQLRQSCFFRALFILTSSTAGNARSDGSPQCLQGPRQACVGSPFGRTSWIARPWVACRSAIDRCLIVGTLSLAGRERSARRRELRCGPLFRHLEPVAPPRSPPLCGPARPVIHSHGQGGAYAFVHAGGHSRWLVGPWTMFCRIREAVSPRCPSWGFLAHANGLPARRASRGANPCPPVVRTARGFSRR